MDFIKKIVLLSSKHHEDRPTVTMSYAQSLDGSIAVSRSQPFILSGRETRIMTHHLRAHHDALLVGIGTILSDNPQLDVRLAKGKDPQPVILDSTLRFPLDARALSHHLLPWIFTTDRASHDRKRELESLGVHIMRVRCDEYNQVDLPYVLRELHYLGVQTLLVEGGARVITAFFSYKLVDKFVITITPIIVGGLHAIEHLLVSETYKKFPKCRIVGTQQLGNDAVIWGSVL
jgi:GTP cyclohydrolase II